MTNLTPNWNSSLQLRNVFFPKILVEAVQNGKPGAPSRFEQSLAHQKLPAMENHWQLELGVRIRHGEESNPFIYQTDIVGVAVIECAAEMPEAKRDLFARVNGFSLLYGSIREMILNLSSRSTRGPLLLPTLNFSEVIKGAAPTLAPSAVEKTVQLIR